jgi:predicted GTPase
VTEAVSEGTKLYFLTGSSGSGKTTLLKRVRREHLPNLCCYHVDDYEVPSREKMDELYGGTDGWQAHNAKQWVRKVVESGPRLVVLDGQIRPTVILAAAAQYGLSEVHVTLIDCCHRERRRRLYKRDSADLDHLDMYAWAAYLRGQADALKLEVIDTTASTVKESALELASSIEKFGEV